MTEQWKTEVSDRNCKCGGDVGQAWLLSPRVSSSSSVCLSDLRQNLVGLDSGPRCPARQRRSGWGIDGHRLAPNGTGGAAPLPDPGLCPIKSILGSHNTAGGGLVCLFRRGGPLCRVVLGLFRPFAPVSPVGLFFALNTANSLTRCFTTADDGRLRRPTDEWTVS